MSCDNCHITKPIQQCSGFVTFSSIPQLAGVDMSVFIQKVSSKKIIRQNFTTDTNNTAKIYVTVPSAYFYKSDSDYLVWVTLNDGSQNGMNDRVDITMGGVIKDCIVMRTAAAYDDSGDQDVAATQILELV